MPPIEPTSEKLTRDDLALLRMALSHYRECVAVRFAEVGDVDQAVEIGRLAAELLPKLQDAPGTYMRPKYKVSAAEIKP